MPVLTFYNVYCRDLPLVRTTVGDESGANYYCWSVHPLEQLRNAQPLPCVLSNMVNEERFQRVEGGASDYRRSAFS